MKKHTKIVATVSDLKCEVDFIQKLYDAGMNVVRMNTAHQTYDGMTSIINNVRTVSDKIALLMDTKGPEIRTTPSKEDLNLKTGDRIIMTGNPSQETTAEGICVSYEGFVQDLSVGSAVLIDDGEIELRVVEKLEDHLLCEVQNNGVLGSKKSVNVPGVRINLPSITEKDRNNILFGIEKEIDFIAHSFVRNKQDILEIQKILDAHKSSIKIIAKIENQEGVENIDEILEVAHGVMVARGDLGIEIPQEKIPGIQRQLIRKCIEAKKPVIVATQMLHSMIKHPRPTRAEVTDVANAIYYRTDAIMLSGETAYGKYPIEAVETMSKIAREVEVAKDTRNDIPVPAENNDTITFLAKQAVKASNKLSVKAVITDSNTGRTARFLAAFRGKAPVYARCYEKQTMRELALSYGVFPSYMEKEEGANKEIVNSLVEPLVSEGLLTQEDMISYLGGYGMGKGTTFLEISKVDFLLANWTKRSK